LARLTGLPETTELEDAAEWFADKLGKELLVEELQNEFTVKEVAQAHVQLLNYPWHRIYTTNYDNVAETAAAQGGRRLTPATLDDSINALPRTGALCVHLNGFIDNLNPETLNAEIKLTNTSYLTNTVAASPWATTFQQDMDVVRAVFFVGYSTADIDIRRLIYERPALKDKSFFVIGPQDDPVAAQKISRFGTITDLDLSGLNAALAKAASSSPGTVAQTPINYCVRQFEPSSSSQAFEDRFVFDLFLHGDLNPESAWQSLHGRLDYCVDAMVASTAMQAFEGGWRAVAIHSDLGNGKTAVMAVLRVKAFDAGYDVFNVVKNTETLFEELLAVFNGARPKLLIIEQYPDWLDTIDFISKNAPQNCVLALSARTSIHDIFVDRLASVLRPARVLEIPANTLRLNECQHIVDLFDRYGLWGDLAAKSRPYKLQHLTRTCNSEWHAILIDRFSAPQIQTRFAPIIDALAKKKRFYEVVMATLVLNVLEYEPSVDLLLTLLGQSVLEKEFRDDASVREVIDTSSGRIRLRSSVAGQFILTKFADPNALIPVLTRMVKAADVNARNDKYYLALLRDLTRFSGLQLIFPEKDRRTACIRYYESIKSLYHTRQHPLFWLQYAIACTVFEEFDRAEKYFNTAYAFAEARDFNTFQIDNHYARFLLMRAIRSKDSGNCMKSFREARKFIFEQIETERRHYPFRVASIIAEFYDTLAGLLSEADKKEIAAAAKHVLNRIEVLPNERQQQRYVIDCREAMQHVLGLSPVS
jgi:SIR2-like domain